MGKYRSCSDCYKVQRQRDPEQQCYQRLSKKSVAIKRYLMMGQYILKVRVVVIVNVEVYALIIEAEVYIWMIKIEIYIF
jgi:hypothetical protein